MRGEVKNLGSTERLERFHNTENIRASTKKDLLGENPAASNQPV